MGYYDIDDILATQENVTTTFIYGGFNLGFIDESSDEKDLKKDSKIDLPFWLSSALSMKKLVEVSIPTFFNKNKKMDILADPYTLKLCHICDYFYEFGRYLMSNDTEIEDLLQKCLAVRYQYIVDRAYHSKTGEFTDFTEKLCNIEKKLQCKSRIRFVEEQEDMQTNSNIIDQSKKAEKDIIQR